MTWAGLNEKYENCTFEAKTIFVIVENRIGRLAKQKHVVGPFFWNWSSIKSGSRVNVIVWSFSGRQARFAAIRRCPRLNPGGGAKKGKPEKLKNIGGKNNNDNPLPPPTTMPNARIFCTRILSQLNSFAILWGAFWRNHSSKSRDLTSEDWNTVKIEFDPGSPILSARVSRHLAVRYPHE